MQVLLKVDQQAALRAGINAAASTVKLEVDPATLTQIERDVLAAVLIDGHDATRLGIQSKPDTVTGQAYNCMGSSNFSAYSNGDPTKPLLLHRPDMDGLRDAIGRVLAEREEKRGRILAEREERQVRARAEMEALMVRTPETVQIELGRDGGEVSYGAVMRVSFQRVETYHSQRSYLSPEDLVRFQAWQKAAQEQNATAKQHAIDAAQAEVKRIVSKRDAEQQAAKEAAEAAAAKAKAEREAMIARLPQTFRDRIAAGYSSDKEVNAALRHMARSDAGLTHEPFTEKRALERLTDEEYITLKTVEAEVRKALPQATVLPCEVADKFGAYRKATENDDPDDVDDDGEVWVEGENERRRIVITWSVAGLEVACAVPFAPLAAHGQPSDTPKIATP
jgi:hypothetical protein